MSEPQGILNPMKWGKKKYDPAEPEAGTSPGASTPDDASAEGAPPVAADAAAETATPAAVEPAPTPAAEPTSAPSPPKPAPSPALMPKTKPPAKTREADRT